MSFISILLLQNLQKKEVEAAVMDQSTIIACIITGVIAFLVGGVLCFFVGVQYHPEFKSRPNRAHPLFRAFVAAAAAQGG